jgi:hypothetical protein
MSSIKRVSQSVWYCISDTPFDSGNTIVKRSSPFWTDLIQSADLVAVRIAQIGEIEAARRGLTGAGRRFRRGSTVGDSGAMPPIDLLGRLAGKANRSTIGRRSRLTIERLGDDEKRRVGAIDIAPALIVIVAETFIIAKHT